MWFQIEFESDQDLKEPPVSTRVMTQRLEHVKFQ